MNPTKLVAPLLILAALSAGIWLIFEKSPPPLPNVDAMAEVEAENVGDGSSVEAMPEIDSISHADPIPDAATQSERKATGRNVRVLDPTGRPLAGVKVYWHFDGDLSHLKEFLALKKSPELMGQPDPRRWQRQADPRITDNQGSAQLPAEGFGMIAAFGKRMGKVILAEPLADGGSQNLELRLEPFSVLPVQVLRADGKPAAGKSVALIGKERILPEKSTFGGWSTWEPIRRTQITDANGETEFQMDLETTPKFASAEYSIDEFEFRVQMETELGDPVFAVIEPDARKKVTLRMDAAGTVHAKLNGYPNTLLPRLSIVDEATEFHRLGKAVSPTNFTAKEGLWIFEEVPLGKRLNLNIVRGFRKKENGSVSHSYRSTKLPTTAFDGPTAPFEIVEIQFDYAEDAWLTGRLLDDDGQPVDGSDKNYEHSISIFDSKGLPNSISVIAEIDTDGNFIAKRPDPELLQKIRLNPDILMIQRSFEGRSFGRNREAPSPLAWVAIPIPAETSGPTFDLGDVQLAIQKPLIEVTVVDEAGNPIKGAQVSFQAYTAINSGGRTHGSWSNFHFRNQNFQTPEKGNVAVHGINWDRTYYFTTHFGESVSVIPISELKATARHNNYLPQTKEFTPADKAVQITLSKAGSILGSIIPSPMFGYLEVLAVPTGESSLDGNNHSRVKIQNPHSFGQSSNPKPVKFNINGKAPGIYDVVFCASQGGLEFHRISGVEVSIGGSSDPRLQEIDLLPYLEFVTLEIVGLDGVALNDAKLKKLRGCGMRYDSTWKSGKGCAWEVHQDRIWFEVGIGQTLNMLIKFDAYAPIRLDGVSSGEFRKPLANYKSVVIEFANFDSLPQSKGMGVKLQTGPRYTGQVNLQQDEGNPERWGGKIAAAGEFTLSVYLPFPLKKRSFATEITLSITEEVLSAGTPIAVKLPADFLESINQ